MKKLFGLLIFAVLLGGVSSASADCLTQSQGQVFSGFTPRDAVVNCETHLYTLPFECERNLQCGGVVPVYPVPIYPAPYYPAPYYPAPGYFPPYYPGNGYFPGNGGFYPGHGGFYPGHGGFPGHGHGHGPGRWEAPVSTDSN